MKTKPQHVLFAGGGCGEHFYPGIAVAALLRDVWPSVQISFAGSGQAWEQREVIAADCSYHPIPCRAEARRFWENFRFLADNAAGYVAARWTLREQRVDLVVGMGGYASAPTVRAASSLGIPTVLLEQNARPGRVTRWLSPRALRVCTAFEETAHQLPSTAQAQLTGTPIRATILNQRDAVVCRQNEKRRLLVLGGRDSARTLNRNVPWACYKQIAGMADWRIIHQAGSGEVDQTSRLYKELGLDALVVSCIDNLPQVLRQTDLAITQATATTLAEHAVLGIPTIVVPSTEANERDQAANTQRYLAAGGCRVVDELATGNPLSDRLSSELGAALLANNLELARLAFRMRKTATLDGADKVVDVLAEILHLKQPVLRVAA